MAPETGRTPEEAVLAWTEAWNAKDWNAMKGVFDPDAEVVAPPGWPEAGEFRGWPAVRDQFKRLIDAWTEERTEVVSLEAIGDVVVYHGRWLGRGDASGLPLDLEFWCVCDTRHGRLTRVRYFFDGEHARAVAVEG